MAAMLRSIASRLAPRIPSTPLRRAATAAPASALYPLPLLGKQFVASAPRSIFTSRLLAQATSTRAAAKEEHEPSSFGEYVDRFGGWYPLLGLGVFVLISKELLVLNEEALMVTNFAAFVAISWLVAGDTVNDAVKAKAEAIRKNHDDVSELYIESLEQVIRAGENSLATLPLMRSLKADFASLSAEVQKAKDMKSRAAARDAVIGRLNALYQKEQSDKAKHMTALLDDVVSEVQHRMEQLTDDDKNAIMDNAIRQLEGGEATGDDRIAHIYRDVLNEKMGEDGAQSAGDNATAGQQQNA